MSALMVVVNASKSIPFSKLEFIKNLDIRKYETNGTDYANPKYNPERIGKRIEEIDIVL